MKRKIQYRWKVKRRLARMLGGSRKVLSILDCHAVFLWDGKATLLVDTQRIEKCVSFPMGR